MSSPVARLLFLPLVVALAVPAGAQVAGAPGTRSGPRGPGRVLARASRRAAHHAARDARGPGATARPAHAPVADRTGTRGHRHLDRGPPHRLVLAAGTRPGEGPPLVADARRRADGDLAPVDLLSHPVATRAEPATRAPLAPHPPRPPDAQPRRRRGTTAGTPRGSTSTATRSSLQTPEGRFLKAVRDRYAGGRLQPPQPELAHVGRGDRRSRRPSRCSRWRIDEARTESAGRRLTKQPRRRDSRRARAVRGRAPGALRRRVRSRGRSGRPGDQGRDASVVLIETGPWPGATRRRSRTWCA